jgi:sugar phosphate permease
LLPIPIAAAERTERNGHPRPCNMETQMPTYSAAVRDLPTGPVPAAVPLSSYRWVILLVAFSVLITSFVTRVAWGNAAIYVSQSLSLDTTAIGSVVTAFFIGYVVSNTFGGFAVDRFGPRRVIFCGLVPLGTFTFCFGFVSNIYEALALQGLMGLSAGVNFAATAKVLCAWFPANRRGAAFGLTATASSLPVIVANAVFPSIIQRFSWETLYRGVGCFAICIAAVSVLALRDNRPGLVKESGNVDAKPTMVHTFLQVIRNKDLVIFTVAGFGATWGTWGFTFWANALLIKGHGYSPTTAGEIMTAFGIGGLISKPLIGLLSDFLGGQRKALILLCFVSLAAGVMIFGSLSSELAMGLVAPFVGVAAFAYNPLQTALVTELVGKKTVGAAAGVSNAFTQIASIICPVVVGFVFGSTGSFYSAFMVIACGPLFSAICMMFVTEPSLGAKE